MRSRVTPKARPTSSSVRGCSPARPKRSSITLRSRSGSDSRALSMSSRRRLTEAESNGDSAASSWTKSPSSDSSSRRSASPARPGAAPCAGSREPPRSSSRARRRSRRERFAPEALHELALDVRDLVQLLDHVHGNSDRPSLVGDRPGHCLADPPGRVRGELEALPVVEFLDRADQPSEPSWIRSRRRARARGSPWRWRRRDGGSPRSSRSSRPCRRARCAWRA